MKYLLKLITIISITTSYSSKISKYNKSALFWRLGGWFTKTTRKIWSHCTRIKSGGHHASQTYRFSTVNYSRTMTRSVVVTIQSGDGVWFMYENYVNLLISSQIILKALEKLWMQFMMFVEISLRKIKHFKQKDIYIELKWMFNQNHSGMLPLLMNLDMSSLRIALAAFYCIPTNQTLQKNKTRELGYFYWIYKIVVSTANCCGSDLYSTVAVIEFSGFVWVSFIYYFNLWTCQPLFYVVVSSFKITRNDDEMQYIVQNR
ncbi:hypothetical protein AGLY_007633 [Aphis glycines]|uniref:Uncharacterized protein n=1 Tax=Aphis glycines TaxID=307491 RepID=A0A6G0TMK6_APHGL|nr:hypothetical protein AGLY_007633 [Aphis glycines]